MKTLYKFSIKTGNGETFLSDDLDKRRLPIAGYCEDAEQNPEITASLLRDLV